jgi:hypothetical protein
LGHNFVSHVEYRGSAPRSRAPNPLTRVPPPTRGSAPRSMAPTPLTRVAPPTRGSAPRSMAPTPLTRHCPPSRHVRQTGANIIGADTQKLGANDDGAELRVHFLNETARGIIVQKIHKKGQIAKKLATRVGLYYI